MGEESRVVALYGGRRFSAGYQPGWGPEGTTIPLHSSRSAEHREPGPFRSWSQHVRTHCLGHVRAGSPGQEAAGLAWPGPARPGPAPACRQDHMPSPRDPDLTQPIQCVLPPLRGPSAQVKIRLALIGPSWQCPGRHQHCQHGFDSRSNGHRSLWRPSLASFWENQANLDGALRINTTTWPSFQPET